MKPPEILSPEELRVDPFAAPSQEEIEAAARHSERLMRLFEMGAALDPQERELAHARLLERAARTALAAIGNNEQVIAKERQQLIEALITQGRYEEAQLSAYALDLDHYAKDCKELIEARDRPDEDGCDCAAFTAVEQAQGGVLRRVEQPKYLLAYQCYSAKHAAFVNALRCTRCGDINLTSLSAYELSARSKGDKDGAAAG